jgi:hypoxanthine phosphoribosyltransferase
MEISRSEGVIDRDDYLKLFELSSKNDWLEEDSKQRALFDLWSLCQDQGEKLLIADLINRFNFVTHTQLDKYLLEWKSVILDLFGLTYSNTLICSINDKSKPDSSSAILYQLKSLFAENQWRSTNFIDGITYIPDRLSNNTAVVFVDDFIGTGDTINRKVKWINRVIEEKKLTNVAIYILSIGMMESALKSITASDDNIYSCLYLKKGISDFYDHNRSQMIDKMKRLETELNRIGDHSLGFKGSEALYGLQSKNIPNNVFPIFWWGKLRGQKVRPTLFSRLL